MSCMVLDCLAWEDFNINLFLNFFPIIASYMYQKLNLCMNFNTSESMWNEQEGVVGVSVSVAHISSQFIPMLYETCCSLSKIWKE
jgi:hypothetical protein